MIKGALIVGSSIAGIQAALDLADSGIPVHLIDSRPFLGNEEIPTKSPHLTRSRILEAIKHPNVHLLTNAEIKHIEDHNDQFHIEILQKPRYVDLSRCTACGECTSVCPVTVPGTTHKAIYIDGQPGCAAISKTGKSPCANACPSGVHVQGYVALIAQKRYQEAIDLIREALPFPSVCGRVCNHQCEAACTRGQIDEAVNIMALKRFVADWAYRKDKEQRQSSPHNPIKKHTAPTGKSIAIIGAGPAGLTAARDLLRLGYAVTVFDALPVAGGMMRVGIPPHRLPSELLDWEIQQIIDEGLELHLNTWVDNIPALLESGYEAALIATGAHVAKKIPLRNSNHPDNWLSLKFLRRVCLGEKVDLTKKKIVVLGGGNVALDTARTALRLGAERVCMACLEPRGEMPGFDWEIAVAEEEGVELWPGRTFKEVVVENNKIVGVQCSEVVFHGFKGGRPNIDEIPGTDHIIPADIVIWAIGQGPDFSFLPQDGSINTRFPVGIQSDNNMMTTMPGVFVAGDVHRGVTFFVVDAISEGHKAAKSIDQYLQGKERTNQLTSSPIVKYNPEEAKLRFLQSNASQNARTPILSIPIEERFHNFREIDLTFTEEEALAEAKRCLACGACSECMACVKVCKADAIHYDDQSSNIYLDCTAIIYNEPFLQEQVSDSDFVETTYHQNNAGTFHLATNDLVQASAVAAQVMQLHAHERIKTRRPPSALEVIGPARSGVFICQCGTLISNVLDTQEICQRAASLPGVVHAQVLPFSCTPEAEGEIRSAISRHSLNQIVIAACSCCPMDQVCFSCTYQRVRCKNQIGIFSPLWDDYQLIQRASQLARFEFVNIREQCAWAHSDNPKLATDKAISLVSAAVARIQVAPAKLAGARSIDRKVAILGNGLAAQFCLSALERQGITGIHVTDIPSSIVHSGGLFYAAQDETLWQASAIVLAPVSSLESQQLMLAFGRERRQPQVRTAHGGVDTRRPGIYYCDLTQDAEISGFAAAARVAAWLGRAESHPPIAAIVDPTRCRACKTCIEACEYGAPELVRTNGRYHSWIDPAICTGCGTCAAHCPSGAISAGCSTDAQIDAMLSAILTNE